MIYTSVNVKINSNGTATSSNKVVLYRGDREVEIQMTLTGNPYIVKESTFAQLIIRRDNATPIITGIAPLKNSKVILTITEENIDELTEVGEYAYQIRLYDDDMSARITLPPVENGLEVREPIVDEASGAIGRAMVNYSLISRAAIDENSTFNEYDEYNKTTWRDGDYITDVKMNKIEDALYVINQRVLSNAESAYISTDMHEDQKVGVGESLDISFEFISPNKGKGTLKVSVNGIQKMTQYVEQEELITINLPEEYFNKGDNKVTLYVVDRAGKSSNELIFMVRYGSTELTPDFDQYSAYQYGASVRYYFIPSCLDTSSKLLFYMEIDGTPKEPMECTSDVRGYYTFPNNLSVGAHHCKAYLIDAQGNRSNEVIFNLIIIDAYSIVIASDTKNPVVEEGSQLVLDYKIYMENADTFITKVYVDDVLVSSGECGLETAYYRNSSLTEGNHIIRIEAWNKEETISDYVVWNVTVTESMFERIMPATAGGIFLASASDHSNSDQNRDKWVGVDQDGNEVIAQLENFTFDSESGWVDNELVFGGVAKAVIPIKPLANNARYGFTLDLEFTSTEIGAEGALVLDLWDYTKDCGIKITTEKLRLRSAEGNEASLYFEDSANTSVMFVIDRNEKKAKIYLNGVMCSAFNLSDYESNGKWILEDFTVDDYIRLGGKGSSKIRNLRVYQVALTTNEIINNFISNKQSKEEQKELVEFQKGLHLPTLTIYCDFSGLGKDDKKPCKIVYSSTDEEKYGKSFELDHKESSVQYQGTSSMAYPIKNYRINLRDENGDKLYYDFPFGQPECRFTLKADFMSSGHWQNTGLTKWINDNLYNYNEKDEKSMNPKKWFDLQNGGSIDDTRECIYGFPCRLILVNDGNTPLNAGQNEPTPGNTKDMGIFNFNHDKDATDTMGFDKDNFPNCMGFEVTANSDTSAGAFMRYTGGGTQEDELEYYKQSFELRFPDEDDVEPWYGFLGINAGTMVTDFYKQGDDYSTSYWEWDIFNTSLHISSDKTIKSIECYNYDEFLINMAVNSTDKNVTLVDGVNTIRFIFDDKPEYFYINDTKYILGNEISELKTINPYLGEEISPEYGIKRLVEWVDTCSDEEFVRDFEQYFHKDYTLRYYLLVITLGMVDNLGKNMMLDSWDGKIFMPRFYDCDTICSYDNTGDIVFDVDIEMAQGYWNTSSSRLWTRIRDLMHQELVEKYNNMRQNGLSYESLMKCFYDEQIAKIPQKYYNMDYDVKYAPFGDSYMGMAHGDGYEHLKRWLKKRILFVDSLFDYAPSYTSDMLTIRANTTETMSLTIETYDPQYVHVSWYNGQMDKIKVDGKTPVTFTGRAMAATDQEVLIYGGTNIKKLSGISTMNPGELIIGAATRLAELDASNCPILTQINLNKANLSAHPQLTKLNLSNCPQLGGNLRIDNSKLIQELNITNTAISGINFPPKMRNLSVLAVGKTNITSLNLSGWDTTNVTNMGHMFNDCFYLTTIEGIENWNTSNVTNMSAMFNGCSNLTNLDLSNFDISKVTNMSYMFRNCRNLTSLDLSSFDISNVTNTGEMFGGCSNLSNLDLTNFDTTNVTNMSNMFAGCGSLTSLDLSSFDTSSVINMNAMFHDCGKLTNLDLSGFDTSSVTSMGSMFSGCSNLTSLDLTNFNTSKVANMSNMFDGCSKVTNIEGIEDLDTSSVTNMNSMFSGCSSLTSLDLSGWDTSKVVEMRHMFYDCTSLTSIEGIEDWDTSEVTQLYSVFYNCSSLTSLDLSGFNVSKADTMACMFYGCNSLTSLNISNFDIPDTTNIPTMFTDCNNLIDINAENCSESTLIRIIEQLPVRTATQKGRISSRTITNDISVQASAIYWFFRMGVTIAKFATTDTSMLPVCNDGYVYAVSDITDNGDGTSTVDITSWDDFNSISFKDNTSLVRVEKLKVTSNVASMSYMFDGCKNLTSLDASGWDTSNVTSMHSAFRSCNNITSLNLSGWDTSKVTNMSYMFYNCANLTSIEGIKCWDTSKVTNMTYMFNICQTLPSLDLSGWDTSSVTNISVMFRDCSNLTSLNLSGWDTSKVISMSSTFHFCSSLTNLDLSGWDTSSVTNMSSMFSGCCEITSIDLSNFVTSSVINMSQMFNGCDSLTSIQGIENLVTSKTTHIYQMFGNCKKLPSLDLSDWDTSKVTHMYSMFYGCHSLTSLDLSGWDTSSATAMGSMFCDCKNLTSLDLSSFNTSKVSETSNMFYGCSNLTNLDLSNFDTSSMVEMSGMFSGCISLIDINAENCSESTLLKIIEYLPSRTAEQKGSISSRTATSDVSIQASAKYWFIRMGNTIAKFTTTNTSSLPVFNSGYNYAVSDIIDNGDGTSTIDITSWDNFSSVSFRDNTALVGVEKLKVTSNVTSMQYMFYGCNKVTSINTSDWDTSNVADMDSMFYDCLKLTSIEGIENWDTSNVTNMGSMFQYCKKLTSLDLSDFDTSKVIGMSSMFGSCDSLTSLDLSGFDTSGVTSMNSMFYNCSGLTNLDLSGFDTSSVTTMYMMFNGCSNLTTIEGIEDLDTSSVITMYYMFYNCSKLTSLDLSGWDTSELTNTSYMFRGCSNLTNLNLSNFNTSKVIGMSGMFQLCEKLTNLDLSSFNTYNADTMSDMFSSCKGLTSLDVSRFDTSNVTKMSYMFRGCSNLTSLDLSNFNTSKVTETNHMFYECTNLTNLDLSNFDISDNVAMYYMFGSCNNLIEINAENCSESTLLRVIEYLPPRTAAQKGSISSRTATSDINTQANAIYWFIKMGATVARIITTDTAKLPVFNDGYVYAVSDIIVNGNGTSTIDITSWDDFSSVSFKSNTALIGVEKLKVTSNVTSMYQMFDGCNKVTSINTSGWDTSNVTNIYGMFYGCNKLTSLDLSDWDTSNVTNMNGAFIYCNNLTSLDISGWDTSKVTSMSSMFQSCNKLTHLDLSNFDTSKVEKMNSMFYNCDGLTSLVVYNFDTYNVTDMNAMFYNCANLTRIEGIDDWGTSKVTNMNYMFGRCNNLIRLDLSNWDTSDVTNMGYMFYDCLKLTSLDLSNWVTSNVTVMANMFCGCVNLTDLDLSHFDITKVTSMDAMFSVCETLMTLNIMMWPLNDMTQSAINTLPIGDDIVNDIKASAYFAVPTGWTLRYSNPYDIVIYTCTESGVLPTFNTEYTGYSVEETNNGDGTYTTCIRTNDLEVMPTIISFDQGTSSNKRLLRVDKLVATDIIDAAYMFRNNRALTHVDLSQLNTSKVTSMSNMFTSCEKLTSLDVSGFNTSNVTDMGYMFYNCLEVTSLDVSGFNTSNVTDMIYMFNGCKKLTSLDTSGWNVSKVTNMANMFRNCSSLTNLDLSDFVASEVTDTTYMFSSCTKLTSLDLSSFTSSKVTDMSNMFRGCENLTTLDVSGLDTSRVTSMNSMFRGCGNLASLDVSGFDTSRVTRLVDMFYGCTSLTSLDLSGWDTSKVITMDGVFYKCSGLTSIDVSGFDLSSVTTMELMFSGCSDLTRLNVTMWPLNDITQSAISSLPSGDDTQNVIKASAYFTVPTGWTLKYSNPYDIAIYTCTASGVLPTFNTEYTGYTVEETNNGDGTYTTRIRTNDLDVMPTIMKFAAKTALIRVEKLSITSHITSMHYMFNRCSNLTSIEGMEDWDTSNVTEMTSVFNDCSKLTNIDVSGFNTSKVTDMTFMFDGCSSLTSLDLSGWDTSAVTNMRDMFTDCSGLTSLDVSGFKTSKVTNMYNMFDGCSSLTSIDVSGWDTSAVTSMSNMFNGCSSLTSLDVSGFKTSKVTTMVSMFNDCQSLTSLDLSSFDTSNVFYMNSMFYNCLGITSLDLSNFVTSKVTEMRGMFTSCKNLTTLNLSSFDTSKVTDMTNIFQSCSNLTYLNSMMNISTNLSLSGTKLDVTSLADVIDNLATVTSTKTLTVGPSLFDKLGMDQISTANNKGWTLA